MFGQSAARQFLGLGGFWAFVASEVLLLTALANFLP